MPSSSDLFSQSLLRTERDTLGLDAGALRRLHADVLGSSERAQSRGLDALCAKAEAPRPAGTGVPISTRVSQSLLRLDVSRAGMEDIAPREEGEDVGKFEQAAADAAEVAWRIQQTVTATR